MCPFSSPKNPRTEQKTRGLKLDRYQDLDRILILKTSVLVRLLNQITQDLNRFKQQTTKILMTENMVFTLMQLIFSKRRSYDV